MESDGRHTFFIFGDLPYASPEAINYVLNLISGDENIDLYIPICKREKLFKGRFDDCPYMYLDDGRYRTANMAMVNVKKALPLAHLFEMGFQLRRLSGRWLECLLSLFGIFKEIGLNEGLGMGWKYFRKRFLHYGDGLKLDDIKNLLQRKFGLTFSFIITPYVDTVIDVDNLKNYEYILNKRFEKF